MDEALIRSAVEYVTGLFAAHADGHDAGHTLRVYETARRLAADTPGCDVTVAALAALLHDADDPKLFDTADNANARAFLSAHDVPPETAARVLRAIRAVSFSANRGRHPDTPEGRVVQDADRLDAIGAIGIARTFAYGGSRGRSLEESVRHFYDKLLLLRDELNTLAARELARRRHAFLLAFLDELAEETGMGKNEK
ncbi:MAG: HD domain-containing protein [Oscillospiraceae bacterium]|nr:HD domain-containing protein [Oscillospiraceae bacterium]